MTAPAKENAVTAHTTTQRIVDDIAEQIRSGDLRPGEKLPTARELRERYDCSQGPVRTAMDRLRAAGLIDTVPGVGAFVRSR